MAKSSNLFENLNLKDGEIFILKNKYIFSRWPSTVERLEIRGFRI